jgi:hypothetical protein
VSAPRKGGCDSERVDPLLAPQTSSSPRYACLSHLLSFICTNRPVSHDSFTLVYDGLCAFLTNVCRNLRASLVLIGLAPPVTHSRPGGTRSE